MFFSIFDKVTERCVNIRFVRYGLTEKNFSGFPATHPYSHYATRSQAYDNLFKYRTLFISFHTFLKQSQDFIVGQIKIAVVQFIFPEGEKPNIKPIWQRFIIVSHHMNRLSFSPAVAYLCGSGYIQTIILIVIIKGAIDDTHRKFSGGTFLSQPMKFSFVFGKHIPASWQDENRKEAQH